MLKASEFTAVSELADEFYQCIYIGSFPSEIGTVYQNQCTEGD